MRIALLSTVPSTLKAFYRPLIHALREAECSLSLISSPGPELDELASMGGIETIGIPMRRSISLGADVVAIASLIRTFRRGAFDLIHTHTPKAGLVGMIAGGIARVPRRLHTLHGLPFETATGLKRRLLIWADRITCGLADTVCVVSESVRQRAVTMDLCDEDKAIVLGAGSACGVDLARFTPRAETASRGRQVRDRLGIDQPAMVIGYCGWLVADKGITDLVTAFGTISRSRSDVHLLMMGSDGGTHGPIANSTRRTMETDARIHYVGHVDDPEVHYAAMDVLVLPTRREGFPYALLEAAAMELPVVATRATGCVDAVVHGETGLLVDIGDTESLARAISVLLDDKVLRKTMGTQARQRVERCFGCDVIVAAHLSLYGLTLQPNGCTSNKAYGPDSMGSAVG